MRHLARRLLNLLTLLSLLVCAAVCVMWISSAALAVDVPLFGYRGSPRHVYVSSTAFRAVEVAVVKDPVLEREKGYFYLRRSPAVLGVYVGPVANRAIPSPATSGPSASARTRTPSTSPTAPRSRDGRRS
jgi:hypothetical protein